MSHLPYGYVIENGEIRIDEEKADKVKELFDAYISGLSLQSAAQKAGLDLFHGSVGKMLRNKRYLGDDYYPPIIDAAVFNKAEGIRAARAAALGRTGRTKEPSQTSKTKAAAAFVMPTVECKFSNPFKQAEYIYSKIKEENDE